MCLFLFITVILGYCIIYYIYYIYIKKYHFMSYLYIDYLKDIYTKGGSKKVQDFCFFINY